MFERKVPRYTSYPTAAFFEDGIGSSHFDSWTRVLPRNSEIEVYLHIPFCAQICWFCACRTQGLGTGQGVGPYLEALKVEVIRTGKLLPKGTRVTRLSWGGGSPSVLEPNQIADLGACLRAHLPIVSDSTLSVEIDPRHTDTEKLDALAALGMRRVTFGVTDFDPDVQQAVGRRQSRGATAACVAALRQRGVTSVGIDVLYGLPHQTTGTLGETIETVVDLAPDRIALTGYAHVPWMAKRQRMISESSLPDTAERLVQFEKGRKLIARSGYVPVGIDHFSRPSDPLAEAAMSGRLTRTFQGYGDDGVRALLGLGVSSISRFPQGYVQNASRTRAYIARIEDGLAGAERGVALTLDDRIRGRAIEMLMCGFRIDLAVLREEFGDFVDILDPSINSAKASFGTDVLADVDKFEIIGEGPLLARLVARHFDCREIGETRYSQAI